MKRNGTPTPAGSPVYEPLAELDVLAEAVVNTVAYADIFDYPLTAEELHRYLKGLAAPATQVQNLLANGALIPGRLSRRHTYYTLPGRESIIETRLRREQIAASLWPHAWAYGRTIAWLPFVRMVAVTGSLAVNNPIADADIDYFVVTAPGRVWLCRALTILVVRRAARRGIHLCPNYFLSAEKLNFTEQSLYAAHELAQMVPISGMSVYNDLWAANEWVYGFLPNATRAAQPPPGSPGRFRNMVRRGGEWLLAGRPVDRLERWEMERKINRFTHQTGPGSEAAFCVDWCKGHFDNHRQRTLDAYTGRVKNLANQPPEYS